MKKQTNNSDTSAEENHNPGFWKRILKPIINELNHGKTIPELSLAVTLGVLWGMFPVIGTTTVILAIITFVLRLNHPAVQLFNYLVYPFQILFIIPFVRIGYWLSPKRFPGISADYIKDMFDDGWADAIKHLAEILYHGILGWAVVMIPLSVGIYYLARWLMKAFVDRRKQKSSEPAE